jgi:cyclic-di-AMP phosphodiesterase PgpH
MGRTMGWIRSCLGNTTGFVRNNYSQLILLLIFSVLVSLFYPAGRSFKYTDLHVGDISQEAIEAPIDFEVLKDDAQLRRDRGAVRMSINPIFSAPDTLMNFYRNTLGLLFDQLLDTTTELTSTSLPLKLDLTGIEQLDSDALRLLQSQLERVLVSISGQFLVSSQDLGHLEEYQQINVVNGAIERVVPTSSLISFETLNSQILERLEKQYTQLEHPVGFSLGIDILRKLVVPSITYDQDETDRLVEDAISRVPIARGFVRSGELIVDRHQRITPEAMSKLRSLGEKLATRQQHEGTDDWSLLGRLLLTLIFVGLMTVYLYNFRPVIFSNLRHMPALLLVLLLILAVVRLEFEFGLGVYASPIPLLGVLLTLMFDLRVAFFLLILMSLLAGSIYGNDFTYLLVAVITGIVAAWTVRNLQRYSRFLATSLGILLAFTFANLGLNLTNYTLTPVIEQEIFTSALNAIATPVLALILLWLLKMIFGVTSDLQLLKLGRLDHPLLRKLALSAPGTFQQTVKIGTLAEAGARRAGVNCLLTRAGTYFRDLGKSMSGDSFRENRNDKPDLPALKLASVIRKHVQAGVSIARQNHLPGEIIDIIRQHHGTDRLDHLLKRARTEAAAEDIHLAEFRYPGELPRTEESSIVMLADTVGGAVFNNRLTSPEEIEKCVDTVIQSKIANGQLDESVLSMRSLRCVRNSFIETLIDLQKEIKAPVEEKPESTG